MKTYKPLLLLIFPLFWVILSYFETGSLLGFIHSVSSRKRTIGTGDSVLYNFLYMALSSGMIIGLVYLKKNRSYLWLVVITLLMWTIGTAISGAMATHNLWRTGLVWNILLIPTTAYLICHLKNPVRILLLISILLLSVSQTLNHSKESYTKIEDLEAGKFISTLDNVVMPRYQWEFMNLMVFNPKIIALDKITSIKGYDYIILQQEINSKLVKKSNG